MTKHIVLKLIQNLVLCVLLVHLCTSIADENIIDARSAEEGIEMIDTAPVNVQQAPRKGRSDPLTIGVIGGLLLTYFSKKDCEKVCVGPFARCQLKLFKGYECIKPEI